VTVWLHVLVLPQASVKSQVRVMTCGPTPVVTEDHTTMTSSPRPLDLPRVTLAIVALATLILGTAWVMRPFVLALVWAAMIAVATWPILLWFQRRFGGRRGPAVAVMVLVLLAFLVVPLYLGISTIVENSDRLVEAVKGGLERPLPDPPGWLGSLPLVGASLEAKWLALSAAEPGSLGTQLAPYAQQAFRWLIDRAGSVGGTIVQFLLTVIITAILFSSGEAAATGLRRFFRRLAGQKGEGAVELAGKAVRAVALGVVVTALVQSVLAGVGMAVAGNSVIMSTSPLISACTASPNVSNATTRDSPTIFTASS